ncbi:MAG: hypothetical protein K0R53_1081 [Burkholderiales bacterium]|jgi:hypothetical protein|nr:hypothetical protein [Burkholderiales bacterium]
MSIDKRRISLLAAFALLPTFGCTMIGHEKVADWPELQVREHHVAHHVMRDKCSKYVAFGMSPDACAEFNLHAGTCDIWYSADFPPGPSIIDHERLHCRGYDHIGGDVLRRAVAAWKKQQSTAFLPAALNEASR